MEDFMAIYKILRTLKNALDYDEFDTKSISADVLGISINRWKRTLQMLVDEGYIDGIQIYMSADGLMSITYTDPRITLSGLEYLAKNEFMQKAARMAKGFKD